MLYHNLYRRRDVHSMMVRGAIMMFSGLLLSVPALSVRAQESQLVVTYNGPRDPSIPATPIDAFMNIAAENFRTKEAVAHYTKNVIPKDSMTALSVERARKWLATLSAGSIKGLQVDPYGVIAVMAKQEAVARQQIDARLATPGLSATDRAFTLRMAVAAFTSDQFPERLGVAEEYLTKLYAMGPESGFWQFTASMPLIYTYYRLGRADDVVRIGLRAFEGVNTIPFEQRGASVYSEGTNFFYGAVIDALSGRQGGRAAIQALNVKLLAGTTPPADVLARAPGYAWQGRYWERNMKGLVAMSERVGAPGTPIVSNYWVNRGATRDSQSVSVTDGRIHIIEIGSWTCGSCIAAIPGIERLHKKYPDVDFSFVTATLGYWGNRVVEPKVEAERLADHFINNLKASFPIGITLCPRVATDDGGSVTVNESPMWSVEHYPQVSKPTFYIVDGKGIIRRVLLGYSRDLEQNIADVIEFLQKEGSSKTIADVTRAS